jgi:hypothetical protein
MTFEDKLPTLPEGSHPVACIHHGAVIGAGETSGHVIFLGLARSDLQETVDGDLVPTYVMSPRMALGLVRGILMNIEAVLRHQDGEECDEHHG